MSREKEILYFIKKFQNEGTIKTFTEGCCFWFAKILNERFCFDSLEECIMYHPIDNHFATWIDGRLYDITGEIPLTPEWQWWHEYMFEDELVTERIFRDCIDFLNYEYSS